MYEATTIINMNTLIVMESLDEGEMHTGSWLVDDLAAEMRQASLALGKATVRDRDQFFGTMERLRRDAGELGRRYILQIDAHGDQRAGLLLKPSGQVVSWREFVDASREVNNATLNNLVVVLACCHGFHAVLDVSIRDLTPFCSLVGPSAVITAGTIQSTLSSFYRSLIATNDYTDALRTLTPHFDVFHAERVLVNAYLGYIKSQCKGRGRRERVDRLLTELRGRQPHVDLTVARGQLKALTRPDPQAYEGYKERFLMSAHLANAGRFPSSHDALIAALEREQ